jgi:hypothetical protein
LKDNVGALTLANLELPQMTPRSKAIGVRYHWFRQYVSQNNGEDGGPCCQKLINGDKSLQTHRYMAPIGIFKVPEERRKYS